MARMKNIYEIDFQIKRWGTWRHYLIHIDAFNKAEATAEAKRMWYEDDSWEGGQPHMFSIGCRRVPLEEVIDYRHWFTQIKNNPKPTPVVLG